MAAGSDYKREVPKREHRPQDAHISDLYAIYAVVAEQGDGVFVVKIGFTGTVYARYASLLPGVPFKSVMLWSWCSYKPETQRLEKQLHKHFAKFSTRGEWFRFKQDEKDIFHKGCKDLFFNTTNQILKWQSIEDTEAYRHNFQKMLNKMHTKYCGKTVQKARRKKFWETVA
jgi:hypothetical protein